MVSRPGHWEDTTGLEPEPLSSAQYAALGSGADFWTTKAIGDLRPLTLADGPHGIRRQDPQRGVDRLGIGYAIPATCFPPAVALAQTWDPQLAQRVGQALSAKARTAGVDVVLGPGINIKRDPRGGRNFEYLSEDPLLTGALAAAWVRGLQSGGVAASLKHFAVNNQEQDRMRLSADIDPRPLREIYLRAFQHVVTQATPWTVMTAYNRINGVHASENPWLLSEVLRGEWGFDGVVLSDWGAVVDRVAAVRAGLDLEMPGSRDANGDRAVQAALEDGSLDQEIAAASADRLRLLAKRTESRTPSRAWSAKEHHALAYEVASRAIVLLKNDKSVLPLDPRTRIAVIGRLARHPRFQGGGSSHVNATHVDQPLEMIRSRSHAPVRFAPGYGHYPHENSRLIAEAVRIAKRAEAAVVFLGLDEGDESEGLDRASLDLPREQLDLLEAVASVQPRTIALLSHGGVVLLDQVVEHAQAILDGALLGQAGGAALADVLYGIVNPSGRLAETVPCRLEDVPAYDSFTGEHSHARYGEGIFVGYRWYDRRRLPVAFPFGHGLSYTNFAYDSLSAETNESGLRLHVTVTNTGVRAGREVVQAYFGVPGSSRLRAVRELAAFETIEIAPGESCMVTLTIPRERLACWDVPAARWVIETGRYEVHVGASSRDLRQHITIDVLGCEIHRALDAESTIAEVLAHPIAARELAPILSTILRPAANDDAAIDVEAIVGGFPIGRSLHLLDGALSRRQLDDVLNRANTAFTAEPPDSSSAPQ